MESPTLNYDSFLQSITHDVADQLSAGTINIAEALALLKMLDVTKNSEQLHRLLPLLADRFPILQKFVDQEAYAQKLQTEQGMYAILSKMMKDNPTLAAEISQAVIQHNLSLAQAQEQYPQISTYL